MAFPLDDHPTFAGYAWLQAHADRARGSTARQAMGLRAAAADPDERPDGLRDARGRRAGAPGLRQFDVVRKDRRPILVDQDELLSDRPALESAAGTAVLEQFPVEQVDVDCHHLSPRVVRLRLTPHDPIRLQELRQQLRDAGVRTSYTHFNPTLPPIKRSVDVPEPAPRRGPKRPAVPHVDGAEAVHVVVLDTGVVTQTRKDFWLYGLVRQDNVDPLDVLPLGASDGYLDFAAGHGTFVAGIVQQVAPAAVLEVRRVLDSDGFGSEVDIACALIDAVEGRLAAGATRIVVNTSFGTETVSDDVPLAFEVAMEIVRARVEEAGAEFRLVAAAGNDGSDVRVSPAAISGDDVIGVASLTPELEPARWSNRGDWVDFSTVGEGVLSTFVKGKLQTGNGFSNYRFKGSRPWAIWSGTSFSAPQVAGALAHLAQSNDTSLEQAVEDLRADSADRRAQGFGHAVRIMPELF